MSDSSSDESSVIEYLPPEKVQKKPVAVDKSKDNDNKKPAAPAIVPKPSYTGSLRQPMSVDSDASSTCSLLEVLPPAKAKSADMKPAAKLKSKESPPQKKAARLPSLDDSSSDSDDDSLLNGSPIFKKKAATAAAKKDTNTTATKSNSKEAEQQRKKLEQERKKQEKLAQKQAEQERKKAERQALKEQREADKEAAKEGRKRQRLEQQQARGNFATSEIVMLVDPPLFRRPKEYDCYDWREHEEITTHDCAVQEYRSALGGSKCQALQWIRKSHLEGGASEAWEQLRQNNPEGYTHIDRLVIVFDDSKEFIKLISRTAQDDYDEDDDYPRLRQWLLRLEHSWRAAWPHAKSNRPTILLLLHQPIKELDRQWVEHRRLHKNSSVGDATNEPPNHKDVHEAVSWMLLQFQVECMFCDNYEEIWTTALKMTRALAKSVYKDKSVPLTELECVKRIKPTAADNAAPLDKAKCVWLRQVQQVQGISERKARHLVRHYPTIQSLWQGYAEADAPQELVAGCLSENRYEQKQSDNIYRLLTSTNPEEII